MSNTRRTRRNEVRLEEAELREVTLFAATCARQVLPLFEACYPLDSRPREAISEAEAFAAGNPRTATLRASAWAAYTAAREADDGPAAQAAYAASHAAAAAFLHPLASPHQVKHILGAAIHQALAVELGRRINGDTCTGSEEIRGAANRANITVRNVLQRFPPPRRGGGRFSELLFDLDAQLRG